MRRVGVVAVVAGEPPDRLRRMAEALRHQHGVKLELRIAAPPDDLHEVRRAFRPGGALAEVEFIANAGGLRSAGLNRCVAALSTELVCRVDARSTVPSDYLERCVSRLFQDPKVGVVGGHQVAIPVGNARMEHATARVLNDPLASGGAAYRRRGASGVVDTVYLGAFRREELIRLGGWSEHMIANEDFDLCQRYTAAGYLIWLEDGLEVAYEPRAGLSDLWRQYCVFGRAKVAYWRSTQSSPAVRQLVGVTGPPLGALVAIAIALRRPQGLPVLAIATGIGVVAFEMRRPSERDVVVRALTTLLAPVPAAAFSAGAIRALLTRQDRFRG